MSAIQIFGVDVEGLQPGAEVVVDALQATEGDTLVIARVGHAGGYVGVHVVFKSVDDAVGVAVGLIDDDSFRKTWMSYSPALDFINLSLPTDAVILLVAEPRSLYIDREVVVEDSYRQPLLLELAGTVDSTDALAAKVAGRDPETFRVTDFVREKADESLDTTERRVEVSFHDAMASDVRIAGDFNGWIPDKGVETRVENSGPERVWTKVLSLVPGTYHYRYVVDGHWREDPDNPRSEDPECILDHVERGLLDLPPGFESKAREYARISDRGDAIDTVVAIAGGILVNGNQGWYPRSLFVFAAHQMPRTLGSNHNHIQVCRRLDLAEVDIKAV